MEDESDIIIKCDNMHKTYLLGVEGVPALRGVSLSVKRGEFLCIFGTSGGGKTTMLNLLGTIDKPTKGTLTICGAKIGNKTSDKELAKLRLHKLFVSTLLLLFHLFPLHLFTFFTPFTFLQKKRLCVSNI